MQEFGFGSLDLQIKGAENEHFSQKQEGKKDGLAVFWAKIRNFFLCPHGQRKKTLTLLKQSL